MPTLLSRGRSFAFSMLAMSHSLLAAEGPDRRLWVVQPQREADGQKPAAMGVGEALFIRQWLPGDGRSRGGDGLGPVYNERSCINCHDQGGTGGAGAIDKNIDLITPVTLGAPGAAPAFFYAFSFQYGPDGFEYRIGTPSAREARAQKPDPQLVARLVRLHPGFASAPAVLVHRYGNDRDYREWREWLLGPHDSISFRVSQRNPTPLFGIGRLDAIPDEAIEAGARRRFPGWPTVHGRVSRLADGRIGRFGWKAQAAALDEFVLSAAALEMGLNVPGHAQAADPRIPGLPSAGLDLDQADCDALIGYVRGLPSPIANGGATPRESRDIKAGKALFRSIGCTTCHAPKLGDVEGLYSDLLLHEMAPELSDTGVYGALLSDGKQVDAQGVPPRAGQAAGGRIHARENEWRTPPLWGLHHSAPYLHDGRATTIDEAIRLHGGEAAPSAHRYRQLSPRERGQLERFLDSLEAPPREPLGDAAGK